MKGPPSWGELGLRAHRRGRRDPDLPLHNKKVGTCDVKALLNLPNEDPATQAEFANSLRWIKSAEAYATVPYTNHTMTTKLSQKDIDELRSTGKVEEVPANERPWSTIKIMTVPEVTKGRRRVIEEPAEINERCSKINPGGTPPSSAQRKCHGGF